MKVLVYIGSEKIGKDEFSVINESMGVIGDDFVT